MDSGGSAKGPSRHRVRAGSTLHVAKAMLLQKSAQPRSSFPGLLVLKRVGAELRWRWQTESVLIPSTELAFVP